MRHQLVLVRHAKSAWDDASLADHDRPLAPRGVNALALLSGHLAGAEPRPDLALCSTARRTVDTLDGIRPVLPEGVEVRVQPQIYGASTRTLLDLLRRVDDDVGCTMLVGHNPGMQDLALALASAGETAMHAQLLAKFPTAAAVTLSFEGGWSELAAGTATLDDLFTPRPPRL